MDLALRSSRGTAISTSIAASAPAAGSRQEGMTLIEVLMASLLFLAISLGVVPMFTQSMVSNTSGNDSTKAANFARARAEELMQVPFNHPDLTLELGTEKTVLEYYSAGDAQWHDYPVPAGVFPEWSRVTTVRQYNVDALEDDVVDVAEALPADADPSFVHLKEIEVGVDQSGGLFTSSAKTIRVRTLRAH